METHISIMNALHVQISKLPPEERLSLIEEIWTGLSADASALPVAESVLDELERRRERYEADPGSLRDWDEFRADVRSPRRETD